MNNPGCAKCEHFWLARSGYHLTPVTIKNKWADDKEGCGCKHPENIETMVTYSWVQDQTSRKELIHPSERNEKRDCPLFEAKKPEPGAVSMESIRAYKESMERTIPWWQIWRKS